MQIVTHIAVTAPPEPFPRVFAVLANRLNHYNATAVPENMLTIACCSEHAALLALLEDGRTEAAAENTVLAAVQSWLAHQPERVELQQRQQLAGAVRIPQLEPMYLATVLPRIPWLVEVRLIMTYHSAHYVQSRLLSLSGLLQQACCVLGRHNKYATVYQEQSL